MRKVVVTGMGVVSPLGNSLDETWQGIKEGKSGIANITGFDCTDYKVQIAAEVKDFDASQFVDKREARKMARFTQFAVAAAVQASNIFLLTGMWACPARSSAETSI